jgi:hypothetical protein
MGYTETKAIVLAHRSTEQINKANEIKSRNQRYIEQSNKFNSYYSKGIRLIENKFLQESKRFINI